MRVDLPEPEGPQTTTFSPRPTLRSTSFSAWNAPNHLFTLLISIMSASFALKALAVLRHGKAEGEIDHGSEHVRLDAEAVPRRLGERDLDRRQEIEQPDDQHQRSILE